MISRHPRSPVTVRIAARMEATEGDANTPPATAAVSLERGEWKGGREGTKRYEKV